MVAPGNKTEPLISDSAQSSTGAMDCNEACASKHSYLMHMRCDYGGDRSDGRNDETMEHAHAFLRNEQPE